MTGGKINLLDTTQTSKDFNATGKTSGTKRRTNKSRSPDNEDAVLIDDNSSNGSSKEKGKVPRFTPKEQRRPKVIFFKDPNIVEEYKQIRQL